MTQIDPKWDMQYKTDTGLRYWPDQDLVRFVNQVWSGGVKDRSCLALDLGCGTGRNAWLLWKHGFRVIGTDGSIEALNCARTYLRKCLRYKRTCPVVLRQVVLPNALWLPDNCVDCVVDSQVLQHLTDEQHSTVYKELVRVLKPQGKLWSLHFADGDPETVYAGHYRELSDRTEIEMRNLLNNAGFSVDAIERYERTYYDQKTTMAWHMIEAVKP